MSGWHCQCVGDPRGRKRGSPDGEKGVGFGGLCRGQGEDITGSGVKQ